MCRFVEFVVSSYRVFQGSEYLQRVDAFIRTCFKHLSTLFPTGNIAVVGLWKEDVAFLAASVLVCHVAFMQADLSLFMSDGETMCCHDNEQQRPNSLEFIFMLILV